MSGKVDIEKQIRLNNQAALLFLAVNNPEKIFSAFEQPGDTVEDTARRVMDKVFE